MKQNFFTVCGHEVILKGFPLPSVAPFKYLFLLTWVPFFIVFYNNKHSFIFYFYKALII